jgi:hypothetical protein
MAKRHAVGRQLSDEEQARIWEVAFSCGYFNSLRELGLDCQERPVDRELAKEAWGRLRTAYYKLRATRWEPSAARHRGRRESSATHSGE